MTETIPIQEKKNTITIDGEDFEIWYDSDFMNSEATLLFMKSMVELMEKKWCPPSLSWCLDIDRCKVFYCKDTSNQVVSGIVCFYSARSRTGWILMIFTDSNYRQKGLNTLLFEYVEAYFKLKGAKHISARIHKDNIPRLTASLKNKRSFNYVISNKELV